MVPGQILVVLQNPGGFAPGYGTSRTSAAIHFLSNAYHGGLSRAQSFIMS